MEVTGKIRSIGQTQEIGDKGFKKRDVVVTTEESYPQHISIQFVQDKTSLLDNFKVGDDVKVSINLNGREWTNPKGETVYFNTLQGWKIEKEATAQQEVPTQQEVHTAEVINEENEPPF